MRTLIVIPALITVLILSGCTTHRALRRNTVKQAETVTDIHQQQVLDNLAKFLHDPYAVPSFALATQGTSDVTDRGSTGGTTIWNSGGFSTFTLPFSGDRTAKENWTMTPITDPRKLELMRCAYQRVLANCGVAESICCPDCKKRFNKFYTGRAYKTKYTEEGEKCFDCDDFGRLKNLVDQPCDAPCVCWECGCGKCEKEKPPANRPEPNSDADQTAFSENPGVEALPCPCEPIPYAEPKREQEEDNTGTCHNGDCSGDCPTPSNGTVTSECLYPTPCWFRVGKKCELPKECQLVGRYCGTYVWVPCGSGRDKLAQLTLAILDYAVHEERSLPQKEVTAYLNRFGCPTNKKSAEFVVKANVSTSTPSVSVAKVDIETNQIAKGLYCDPNCEAKELKCDPYRRADRKLVSAFENLRVNKLRDKANFAIDDPVSMGMLERMNANDIRYFLDRVNRGGDSSIDSMSDAPLDVNRFRVSNAMKVLGVTAKEAMELKEDDSIVKRQVRKGFVNIPDPEPLPQMRTPTPGAGLLLQQQLLQTVQ